MHQPKWNKNGINIINKSNLLFIIPASASATLEELYLLQKVMRSIGNQNIDHRLRQVDFSDQNEAPLFPYLGQAIADLENCDAAFIIGSHLRKEQLFIAQDDVLVVV